LKKTGRNPECATNACRPKIRTAETMMDAGNE